MSKTEHPINNELLSEIAKFSHLAYNRKLVTATGGNISVRLGDYRFAITASGVSLRDVEPGNIIIINKKGEKVAGAEPLIPSKEGQMHIEVYKARPDVKAVLHLHSTYCTLLSIIQLPIKKVTVSAELKMGTVPLIPRAWPGSQELADYVAGAVAGDPEAGTIMLANHGILCMASSLGEAFDIAELVEETARLTYLARPVGADL